MAADHIPPLTPHQDTHTYAVSTLLVIRSHADDVCFSRHSPSASPLLLAQSGAKVLSRSVTHPSAPQWRPFKTDKARLGLSSAGRPESATLSQWDGAAFFFFFFKGALFWPKAGCGEVGINFGVREHSSQSARALSGLSIRLTPLPRLCFLSLCLDEMSAVRRGW